jgi:hypothetical protein
VITSQRGGGRGRSYYSAAKLASDRQIFCGADGTRTRKRNAVIRREMQQILPLTSSSNRPGSRQFATSRDQSTPEAGRYPMGNSSARSRAGDVMLEQIAAELRSRRGGREPPTRARRALTSKG